ncbi:hypothetical protein BS17DRAFT_780069 [Gyrodon lividus]|nr:hypothetical protein BS17DRAFT_780069 [Gyrodon lividus]
MTWNGLQGFQTPISSDSFIVDGVGAYGSMHSERGLTYYEVALSGHMVPQFSPVVSSAFPDATSSARSPVADHDTRMS